MTLTPETIAELRRLEQAATPGPWSEGVDGNQRLYAPDGLGANSGLIASWVRRDDLTFIAAARNAIPDLLDRIEELEEYIQGLEGLLRPIGELAKGHENWSGGPEDYIDLHISVPRTIDAALKNKETSDVG